MKESKVPGAIQTHSSEGESEKHFIYISDFKNRQAFRICMSGFKEKIIHTLSSKICFNDSLQLLVPGKCSDIVCEVKNTCMNSFDCLSPLKNSISVM